MTGITAGTPYTLKELMNQAVASGDISMSQEGFKKTYIHWIQNLHDWCISRQIWFGHRIPVWYRGTEIYCSVTAPAGDDWEQDPDVLDTWFSSALWTFSTLGWPEKTSDLTTYHPTSFMSPAYEILSLWVSRMVLMSAFHLGQIPFKTVLIHGLVRDKTGKKFSKSLGNGIDPIEMIEKYGADALRMGLLVGTAIGNDIRFDEDKVKGYKHFANKLWNITRFILTNTADHIPSDATAPIPQRDQEILDNLQRSVTDITRDIDEYRLYMAAEKAYHFVWTELADIILEESKIILSSTDEVAKAARQLVLVKCLITSLKILHPFMPFVTETIWQELPDEMRDAEMLMVAKWPSR